MLTAVAFSAWQIYMPPATLSADADATAFSAERAYVYLKKTHGQPHPLGSAAHDSTVKTIVRVLKSAGIAPEVQHTTGILIDSAGYFAANQLWAVNVQNIVAKIPGTNPRGTILLMAHYDAMPTTCGASDGGAGTASLLEIARALKTSGPLENDVLLFFSDADVNGCVGAETFKARHPLARQFDVAIKVEGMGNGGGAMLIYTGANNYRLVRDFARAAPRPQTLLFANDILNYMQMASSPDVAVMLKGRSAAGMGFAYADNPQVYHTMIDCPDNLDAGVMQQYGDNVLAFTRFLGNRPLQRYREEQPEAVAFSIGRFSTYVYPSTWAMPLALLLTLLLAVFTRFDIKKQKTNPRLLLGDAGLFLAWWIGAMTLSTLVMYGIKKFNPNYAVFLQGIYGFNWYLPMMVALSLALFYGVFRRRMFAGKGQTLWVSAVWWGAVMSLLTAWAAPSASYFFTFPLYGALMLYAHRLYYPARVWPFWGLLIYGVWVALICTPAVLFMYLFSARYYAMGDFPYAFLSVFLFAWMLGMLTPLWQALAKSANGTIPRRAVWATAAVGTVFAAIGLANSGFSDKQPYPNYVAYDYDADAGKAFWFAVGTKTDVYTKQWLGETPERAQYEIFPGYFPDWQYAGWKTEAPLLEFPQPQLFISGDTIINGHRKSQLNIATDRYWNALRLSVRTDHLGSDYTLNGRPFSTAGLPDSLKNRLRIILFNPEDTVRLAFQSGQGDKIHFYLEAYRNGLPGVPGKVFENRSAAMMPAMSEFTDPTVWKKSYIFFNTEPALTAVRAPVFGNIE
jgi:Peptidase family M28